MNFVKTNYEELSSLAQMANQRHIGTCLNQKSLKQHQIEYKNKDTTFLNIISDSGSLYGYCILLRNESKNSVQLKRIIIDEAYLGIGQEALSVIESYCKDVLGSTHMWLDVYEDNARAIHVYEKLGFRHFKDGVENNRKVLFYEKSLNHA